MPCPALNKHIQYITASEILVFYNNPIPLQPSSSQRSYRIKSDFKPCIEKPDVYNWRICYSSSGGKAVSISNERIIMNPFIKNACLKHQRLQKAYFHQHKSSHYEQAAITCDGKRRGIM